MNVSIVFSIMDKFWGIVKKDDDKRLAQQTEPEGIARVYDLPYIDDGDRYHMLDVYYPEAHEGKLPVIIDVHGGGWMYGDKELNRMYCLHLSKRGYVVFNMSYRLAPGVTVGEQLQDVMAAIAWIKAHLSDYPCREDQVLLTGDSAGGQLAAYTAALLSSKALRDVFETADCEWKLTALGLTSPVAYMNVGGYMSVYTTRLWGKDYKNRPTASFMNFDSLLPYATLPPTFLVTSSGDFLALQQTRKLTEDLKAFGIPATLMDFPPFEGKDLPHVFSVVFPEERPGKMAIEGMLKVFEDACEGAKA